MPDDNGDVVQEPNIWYGNKTKRDFIISGPPSASADLERGRGSIYICLNFARGQCQDPTCLYRHQLPNGEFEGEVKDCFGREKYADYRDDMMGVGQLGVINKTLWVAPLEDEFIAYKLMNGYGGVESIVVKKGMGFITFQLEAVAQFVKEAMDGGKIKEDGEILKVRWAKGQDKRDNGDQIDLKGLAKKLLNKLEEAEGNKRKRDQEDDDQDEDEDEDEDPNQNHTQDEQKTPIGHFINRETIALVQEKRALGNVVGKSKDNNGVKDSLQLIQGYSSSSDGDDDST